MAVFRFRIRHDDYDDFSRDIDIKSSQTFEDLHNAIQDAIGFDKSQLASFYLANNVWRKGQEICLLDMSEGDSKIPTMKESVLSDFIDDPHQNIIYVFDFIAMWTFYIELFRIIPEADKKTNYPCCSKSIGDSPSQYKKTNKINSPFVEDVIEEIDDAEIDSESETETSADMEDIDDGYSEITGEFEESPDDTK